MITVTDIAFTGYPVTDMPRARAFYEKLLNLKPSTAFEQDGKSWIEYDVGPNTLAITNMSPDWEPSSQGPAITLEVADFNTAVEAVRNAGVKFRVEPSESPVCHLAVVLDPDGNLVALHKRKHA